MELILEQKEAICKPVKFYINMFCLNFDDSEERTRGSIAGIAFMFILSLSMFKLSFSTRSKIKKMK